MTNVAAAIAPGLYAADMLVVCVAGRCSRHKHSVSCRHVYAYLECLLAYVQHNLNADRFKHNETCSFKVSTSVSAITLRLWQLHLQAMHTYSLCAHCKMRLCLLAGPCRDDDQQQQQQQVAGCSSLGAALAPASGEHKWLQLLKQWTVRSSSMELRSLSSCITVVSPNPQVALTCHTQVCFNIVNGCVRNARSALPLRAHRGLVVLTGGVPERKRCHIQQYLFVRPACSLQAVDARCHCINIVP
jgi:hypothetical protein